MPDPMDESERHRRPAVFSVEKLVDQYGVVFADQAGFPGPAAWEHDWSTPYPALRATVAQERDRG